MPLPTVVQIPVIEIGVVVIVAMFFAALASRFKQSPSIGFILAGVLLGPLFANFLIPAQGIAPIFAELGLLMIMFYLGLELSLKTFRETGVLAIIMGVMDMVPAFAIGFIVSKFFGLPDFEAVLIGTLLPMSSTVIVTKFMIDHNIIKSFESRTALALLVLQDLLGILLLVFLSSLGSQHSFNSIVLSALFFTIFSFYVVSKLSKHVLGFLTSKGHDDKMALYAIGVGILISYFGAFLGLSPILGAYFAGFALAETKHGEKIKRELGFFREFFVLFFFVSFGTSVVLPTQASTFTLLAVIVLFYIIAKILAYGLFGTLLGFTPGSAITTGLLLLPIGEFSLLIANYAAPSITFGKELLGFAFMLVLLTNIISSLLYERKEKIISFMLSVLPKKLLKINSELSIKLKSIEQVVADQSLQNEYFTTLRNMLSNIMIAIAVVYVAYIAQLNFQIDFGFLSGAPKGISAALIVLPFIIWPIYKFMDEFKFMIHNLIQGTVEKGLPYFRKNEVPLARVVSDVLTSFLFVILGIFSTVLIYYSRPDLLTIIIPIIFTMFSMMYFSKSIYSLLEHYNSIEGLVSGVDESYAQNVKVAALSKEFNDHARKFRELHAERMRVKELVQEALVAGNSKKAEQVLGEFRRKETHSLRGMFAEHPERFLKSSMKHPLSPLSKNEVPQKHIASYLRNSLSRSVTKVKAIRRKIARRRKK